MENDSGQFPGLEDGLNAGFAPDSRAPGESVLGAIERLHSARSNVNLREADEGASPVLLRRDDAPAVDDSRYQVLGEIARGGVGVIYKGRDRDLNRDVALKVLRPDHADNPEVIQRFIEEAQVGGQLQHPGIVPVYSMGLQPDGRVYFAMKLIKGETLSSLLDSNPKEIDLLSVYEQIALTMAYAHSRGVIHRDLKPANVMVGAFGEVMVVDWGFAKVLGHDDTDARPEAGRTVIATVRSEAEGSQSIAGSVMGTPAYMPPEQAMGQVDELDERSDVFALGAILTEILSGEPPYTGSPRDQMLAASQCLLDEAHERLDECDAAETLKQIARDCMERLGRNRPADGGVVARRVTGHFAAVEERVRQSELEAIDAEAAADQAQRSRKQILVLASLALVALLASGGGYFWWRHAREGRRAEAQARVSGALKEAAEHEGGKNWTAAISAAKKAIDLAETDDAGTTEARAVLSRLERSRAAAEKALRIERRNAALLIELDEIWAKPPQDFDAARFKTAYNAAIQNHLGSLDEAGSLANSEEGTRLAAHLDSWKRLKGADRERLDRLARTIDPQHNAVRDVVAAGDPDRLLEQADVEKLAPPMVAVVADALLHAGKQQEAKMLLESARLLHPADFALAVKLANHTVKDDPDFASRCYTRALALRPQSAGARRSLAAALDALGEKESAARIRENAPAKAGK